MKLSVAEEVVVDTCAQVIMGAKPANMVAFSSAVFGPLQSFIEHCRMLFSAHGIDSRELCTCGQRSLMLFYRAEWLEESLRDPMAKKILRENGYPEVGSLDALLDHLTYRVGLHQGFPHEIGLFLGYPPEDVDGFIRHGGKDSKLSGYWKVYGNTAQAEETFALYDRCRAVLSDLLEKGHGLSDILHITGGNYYAYDHRLLVGNG